jgi:hypothetical protein
LHYLYALVVGGTPTTARGNVVFSCYLQYMNVVYKKYTIIVFCFFLFIEANAQKNNTQPVNKTQNNLIYRPNKVEIKNKNFNTTNNVNNAKKTGQIYMMDSKLVPVYNKDTNNVTSIEINTFKFANPDSLEMDNVSFSISVVPPFDTAYFVITNPLYPDYGKKFNPFDVHSPVRDLYRTCSADKKTVSFKASYLAAKTEVSLHIIRQYKVGTNGNITLTGVSKLF